MQKPVELVPIFEDNYVFFFTCPISEEVAVVDPGDASPLLSFLEKNSLKLSHILITHHHWDHTGGVDKLREITGATVWGNGADQHRLPNLDHAISAGETIKIGQTEFEILDLSGHTLGHIGYFNKKDKLLFSGDTIFVMGCGRLFEGTPEQMWKSLMKIRGLPDDTAIYCTHEYSLANAEFATRSFSAFDPFIKRMTELKKIREKGIPTVPTSVGIEKKTNPFLMADIELFLNKTSIQTREPSKIFGKIRLMKDNF